MTYKKFFWLFDILLVLVLALAGYLRLTGVNWGEGEHQHPDENTFSSVLYSMQAQKCNDPNLPLTACPPEQKRWLGIQDYFNSKTSTLNPYNLGYGSFVYGNLPMTLMRIAADLTNQTDVRILGRQASTFADLFTILILYLIVSRVYDRRVALLTALFSALAVMQIQQSHFFTTDLFVNTFAFLAIYFVVEIVLRDEKRLETGDSSNFKSLFSNPLFLLSIGFGIAYGMALASKLNIYPLAILLPGAFAVRYLIIGRGRQTDELNKNTVNGQPSTVSHLSSAVNQYWILIIACLIIGGLASLISFRVFQPYAFDGLGLDPRWVTDIKQQRLQATGDADLPWNLQWARRSPLYSFTNLTVWGLGLPLGILAWIGFLYMGWRILKGEWRHALLWGWTAAYFVWQSLQFNPTMRYQLPIYPLLAMMAAWVVFEKLPITNYRLRTAYSVLRISLAVIVIGLTAAWAFAFQSIYTREEPRIAASRWIYQNVPGPINLHIETSEGEAYNQPLPIQPETAVNSSSPYDISFIARTDGLLTSISLGRANNAHRRYAVPGSTP